MLGLIRLIFGLVVDLFRSQAMVEAEVIVLRQQINVLRRGKPTRLTFTTSDRMVLGWICSLFPNARDALAVVRPETVLRWHHAGFRSYWRWKSRSWPGRPALSAEIRKLIREMSTANPLWGAPRFGQHIRHTTTTKAYLPAVKSPKSPRPKFLEPASRRTGSRTAGRCRQQRCRCCRRSAHR